MSRGGRKKDRSEPERRCIVTGDSAPASGLIRFVLGPDGTVVPDILEKLPGRGAWVTSQRDAIETACRKKTFSRSFRAQATAPDALADTIENGLALALVRTISMARRAGAAVTGAEKVRARIEQGAARLLLQATDGAESGIARLAALAEGIGDGRIRQIRLLNRTELGLAFGREFAIHATLDTGGFADRALHASARLAGFRATAAERTNEGQGGSATPAWSSETAY